MAVIPERHEANTLKRNNTRVQSAWVQVIIRNELLNFASASVTEQKRSTFSDAGPAPYVATFKGADQTLANSEELIDFLEERGKKGISISRYKGLGEMNADELWETTMNPDGRTLLQVRIDDAIKTDELFTILMGDQVEPRRAFIEQNALNVKNLDI